MKYIPVEKLIAEIKRLKQEKETSDDKEYAPYELDVACGHDIACEKILSLISSLQQEQPEVDLDYQVFAKEMDAVFNFPKEVTENTEENPLNWEYAIARHFYELGLNARKEE